MSAVVRRNRRREWILRNRLHPQHTMLQQQMFNGDEDSVGPGGVRRRNPRTRYFVGPNGLRRVARSAPRQVVGALGSARAKPSAEVAKKRHQVSEPSEYIAVLADFNSGRLSAHDRDLLGLAQALATEVNQAAGAGDAPVCAVTLVLFADADVVPCEGEVSLADAGVDRILCISGSEYHGYCPEQRVLALSQLEAALQPRYWLFPDTHTGRDLGLRLAAAASIPAVTKVWQATTERVTARGGSNLTDLSGSTPRLLIALAECAMPITETRHDALILPVSSLGLPARQSSAIEDLGLLSVDPNQVPLAEAEFVMAAGNGVQDWPQFHRVAAILGATEGASRVAVDDGNMPRARQVGATGTWISARVYLAVGISGAVQHLQGIGECDKVIAINIDKDCAMVKRADLSVIGDATAILAELGRLAESFRQADADADVEAAVGSAVNQ